jgi:hypothetical protein
MGEKNSLTLMTLLLRIIANMHTVLAQLYSKQEYFQKLLGGNCTEMYNSLFANEGLDAYKIYPTLALVKEHYIL